MLDQLLAVHVEHGQLVLSADKDDVDTQLSFDGLDEALFAGDQEAVLLCCGSLIPDLKYFVVSDNHVVLGIDRLQAGDCSIRLGNFIIGLSEYLDLVQVLIVVQFALRLENLSKFHWILDYIQELFTNFVQNRQVQWLLLCEFLILFVFREIVQFLEYLFVLFLCDFLLCEIVLDFLFKVLLCLPLRLRHFGRGALVGVLCLFALNEIIDGFQQIVWAQNFHKYLEQFLVFAGDR